MLLFLVRRVLVAIPVMLVVAITVFLLLRLTPGDPAAVIGGESATAEQLARIRTALGLDRSLAEQFFQWIGHLMVGDFGSSLISQTPVTTLIAQRVGPTVALATVAMGLTVAVSLPLGILAAWKQGAWIDRAVMALSVVGFSVPVFVTAYVLIGFFAVDLKWFAVQGYAGLDKGLAAFVRHIGLPALALSGIYVALISRMTRAGMLEALQEDYVRTARAKGLGEGKVLFRHALRNAAIPILTVIGTGFAMMVAGVVVTESVFNIPGLGRLVVDAVLARDYPLIQALILLTAGLNILINLLIDLSYAITDPRIRYT